MELLSSKLKIFLIFQYGTYESLNVAIFFQKKNICIYIFSFPRALFWYFIIIMTISVDFSIIRFCFQF